MDLGDQRAGRVDIEHLAPRGLGRHRLRHAMGREDHRPVGGHSSSSSTKTAPLRAQPVDHVLVVHDLVADVDRRAPFLERHLDDLDRPVDAGAEAARRGEVEGRGAACVTGPVLRFACRRQDSACLPRNRDLTFRRWSARSGHDGDRSDASFAAAAACAGRRLGARSPHGGPERVSPTRMPRCGAGQALYATTAPPATARP